MGEVIGREQAWHDRRLLTKSQEEEEKVGEREEGYIIVPNMCVSSEAWREP